MGRLAPRRVGHECPSNVRGQSLTTRQGIKSPTKNARPGTSKEALLDRTRRDHGANEKIVHRGEKRFSVAVNRWLDEPMAEGPYSGIVSAGCWEMRAADDAQFEAGERKKKSGKNKRK